MKASELTKYLQMSSLRTLSVGSSSKKTEEHNGQILAWINRAIQKIYNDLNLAQVAVRIDGEEDKYLYDLPEDYMMIIAAFKSDETHVPINKEDRLDSIYTPEPFKIFLPEMYHNNHIDIIYAKSPKLLTSPDDVVPLPNQYTEAIVMYVSYIAYELIHGQPNWEHQSYLTKYIAEINNLQKAGLIENQGIVNYKIQIKGFI